MGYDDAVIERILAKVGSIANRPVVRDIEDPIMLSILMNLESLLT